jgi:hypothetical protein
MVKKDSGLFEVAIGPLASDMCEYRFILDSALMLDPNRPPRKRRQSYLEGMAALLNRTLTEIF